MKLFTKIASAVFAVIALLHFLRLFLHFEISVLGYEVPLWVNIVGTIVAGILSWGLYRESA